MQGYGYSAEGMYFVTICAHNRLNLFGEVTDHQVRLSKIGEIVQEEWARTAELRPYVKLDKYIIMPNHFHGIIILRWGTSRRAPTKEAF